MVDFVELKTLARNTVGSTRDYLLQEMEITIDIYDQLQSKVEEIELQINDCSAHADHSWNRCSVCGGHPC